MNKNTTVLLALFLTGLVLLLYVVKNRNVREAVIEANAPSVAGADVTRDLFEEKLDQVVKVTVERSTGEAWVFEKQDATETSGLPGWRTTSPVEMPCVRWEVDKFANQLGNLAFEVSFRPGESGAITPSQAGLEPPQAKVSFVDENGRTETVEIGNLASTRTTYVRLAGSDEIFLVKSDLSKLVKDRLLDYRDKQVLNFKESEAVRVEIEDRSTKPPTRYAFVRDGSQWMMESPTTARMTGKIDEMLRAMARLRVSTWHDHRPVASSVFGLAPARLTARVTVETKIEGEDQDAETQEDGSDTPSTDDTAAANEPEVETHTYEVHFSDQSPIGEDNKTFFRVGDELAVGTVMQTVADKFKPVMAQWRDMHITPVDLASATRIELAGSAGQATFVKQGSEWSFDDDGGAADGGAIEELLKAAADLKAVVFLDDDAASGSESFGFDQPQARLRWVVPGVEGVEQLTVGSYTDAQTKRLVYVHRQQSGAVAKVRSSDVETLLRGPYVYRDRLVLDVLPSQFRQITITSQDLISEGATEITIAQTGDGWRMTQPANLDLANDKVDKVIEALGRLRAQAVVGDAAEITAFGLHAPQVKVVLEYSTAEGDVGPSVENASDRKHIELLLSEIDGKSYAKRADRSTIYQVATTLIGQITQELRNDRVLDFDADEVVGFTIRGEQQTHAFEKSGKVWIYVTERDLPLDAKKVENVLLQIRDLRTSRFVSHSNVDPNAFGLNQPTYQVTVTQDDGLIRKLSVSPQQASRPQAVGHYAVVDGMPGVFLLTPADIKRFSINLADLEGVP